MIYFWLAQMPNFRNKFRLIFKSNIVKNMFEYVIDIRCTNVAAVFKHTYMFTRTRHPKFEHDPNDNKTKLVLLMSRQKHLH